MANYRRELTKKQLNKIHSRYKDLVNSDGGIFTKDKRRKLLGLKQKSGKYFEESADFWYDVRTTVLNGLKDFELFFEVSHPKQIKEVLHDGRIKQEFDINKKPIDYAHREPLYERIPSLQKTLNALFRDYGTVKKRNLKTSQFYTYFEPLEEDDEWKAMLADDIISIGIKFLREHNLISSKAHERLTEEFEDMVNVEIARGTKLKRMERVKGYV